MGVMANPEGPRGGSKSDFQHRCALDWAVASRSSLAEGYAWWPSSRATHVPGMDGGLALRTRCSLPALSEEPSLGWAPEAPAIA